MRKNRENQMPLTPLWPDHRLGDELQMISRILDNNPEILHWVLQDLSDKADPCNGSPGLSAEQVVRCAVIKNWHGLSYEKLAFHVDDSASFRAFCRLPLGWSPGKSCLQQNISRIQASTWQRITRVLVGWAKAEGLEKGRKIRVDATAVESDIRHPLDSQLLYDSVRKVTALLGKLAEHYPVVYHNHCRRAKRRVTNIRNSRGQNRRQFYQDLVKVAGQTYGYGCQALESAAGWQGIESEVILQQLRHYLDLMGRVIDQTDRRVLQGQKVPAAEKVVSIFEEHSDIIQTGGRETIFGHKIFLTCGKTSLIVDCLVTQGNPADQAQMQPMLERQHSALRALSSPSQLRRGICHSEQSKVGQEARNPGRGLCQKGRAEGHRYGALQLGLQAVEALSGWNRRLYLDAQTGLRSGSLHLEGMGALPAVCASLGAQFQSVGVGPATVVNESLDAIMEGDFEGEVFVENCIWSTRSPDRCCRPILSPMNRCIWYKNNPLGSLNNGFPDGN